MCVWIKYLVKLHIVNINWCSFFLNKLIGTTETTSFQWIWIWSTSSILIILLVFIRYPVPRIFIFNYQLSLESIELIKTTNFAYTVTVWKAFVHEYSEQYTFKYQNCNSLFSNHNHLSYEVKFNYNLNDCSIPPCL